MQQMEYEYSTEFHFKEGSTIGIQAIVSFQAIVKRGKTTILFCMYECLACMYGCALSHACSAQRYQKTALDLLGLEL